MLQKRKTVGQMTQAWAQEQSISCLYLPQTSSTNALAKDKFYPLIVTDHQTEGRGRGDHSWEDIQGLNLLSSWSFPLSNSPSPVLSLRIGYALFQSLQSSFPHRAWSLKAPNDIFLEDKKIAGLLIEIFQVDQQIRLIVGLGLNLFADPQLPTSTHLESASILEDSDKLLAFELQLKNFLTLWFKALTDLAKNKRPYELSSEERRDILVALNLFPRLSSLYTEISPEADLWIGTKKIPWLDL